MVSHSAGNIYHFLDADGKQISQLLTRNKSPAVIKNQQNITQVALYIRGEEKPTDHESSFREQKLVHDKQTELQCRKLHNVSNRSCVMDYKTYLNFPLIHVNKQSFWQDGSLKE